MQALYLRPYMCVLSHLLGVSWNGIFKKPEINAIIISKSFLPRSSNHFLREKEHTRALSRRHHIPVKQICAEREVADALNQTIFSSSNT